jgi:hypothetical protein
VATLSFLPTSKTRCGAGAIQVVLDLRTAHERWGSSSSPSKAVALCINLEIDGAPISARGHSHPSHSQTSRLLSTSLSPDITFLRVRGFDLLKLTTLTAHTVTKISKYRPIEVEYSNILLYRQRSLDLAPEKDLKCDDVILPPFTRPIP